MLLQHIKKCVLLALIVAFSKASAVNYVSNVAAGNWATGASWLPVGVPVAGDNVTILNGHVITVAAVAGVTNVTINTGGTLRATAALTVAAGGVFTIQAGGLYRHGNTAVAATTIFNGTENFDPASTFQIDSWSANTARLATGVTLPFGNITNNYNAVWDQAGTLGGAVQRIMGTLTINAGQFDFDDGTGGTTQLITGPIITAGTGGLIFQQGANRNLTLTTGAFTHGGTALTAGMYLSYGTLNWTINGNMNVADDFTGIQGAGSNAASTSIQINGNFSITGGLFDWNRMVNAPLTLTVTGNTSISGVPGWVRFIDANAGNLNFTTSNLSISGGTANSLNLGTGSSTVNVTNDLTINGTSATWLINNSASTSAVSLTVGRDFIMSAAAGDFRTAFSNGPVTVNIARDFTLTGGLFSGQRVTTGTSAVVFTVGGNYTFNTATATNEFRGTMNQGDLTMTTTGSFSVLNSGIVYGIYNGDGNLSFTVNGAYIQSNANSNFWGVGGSGTASGGSATYNLTSVSFTGGAFVASSANSPGTETLVVNVTGNISTAFGAATDVFILVNNFSQGFPGSVNNGLLLDFNVNGNIDISGNTTAFFFSSGSTGAETADILGNVTVSGGDNYFVGTEGGGSGHAIITNISGNVNISAGTLRFSSMVGAADINITGNLSVTGGQLAAKVNDGNVTLDVGGNYSQTAGTFFLHKSAIDATANIVAVTINGTFSQTGGIINFDQITTSTGIHRLTLLGSSYTLGGTAIMTRAGAGTATVFGELYFARVGTIVFDRTTNTHQIDQVKQIINAGCTVDASASTNNIQIACTSAAGVLTVTPTVVMMNVNGVLNAGTKLIFGRSPNATQRPTSFFLRSGAQLITANTAGLYDGTVNGTFVNLTRNSTNTNNTINSFNWALDAMSIVTHNSAVNQVVTGKFPANYTTATISDIATASTASYKYGILDINNLGTPGTNYAYPAVPVAGTGNVFVRTRLDMTTGELNLAGSGTGQTITIENSAVTGISRDGAATIGYIKSEEANAGNNRAIVQWNCAATNGAYVIPFGVSNTYIPFTFTKTAGNSNMQFSTRATAANDNLPLAAVSSVPAVSNMNSAALGGANGSIPSTIDRWWNITAVAGPATVTADLIFTYRGVENTTTLAPTGGFAAQHWNGTFWDNQVGSGTGVTAGTGTVSVSGANTFSPWVLTSVLGPLPIELLMFDAHINGSVVDVKWETATEINNDYFTIEKSKDGQNFETVAIVSGARNSSTNNEYLKKDYTPYKGISYYRLKQTDFDGKSTYSQLVPVEYNPDENASISIFPNPIDEGSLTYIALNEFNEEEVVVVLRDITGRELFSKVIVISTKNEVFALNEEGMLSRGSYLITASGKNKFYNTKLIIK